MNTAASSKPTGQPRLEWLGEAVALALGPAIVGAVPCAWRARSAGGSALDGWLVGAAVWLLLLLPFALLRRRAARGWRGLVGADPPRDLGAGLGLWVGLSVTLLIGLGALLEARTHHSGLGGATFGIAGLAVVGVAAVAAHRLVALGAWLRRHGWPPWLLASLAGVVGGGPLLAAATPWLLSRTVLAPPVRAGATVAVDLLLVLALSAALHLRGLPVVLRPMAVKAAVPLGAFLLVVGSIRVELGSGVGAAVRAGGGVPSVVLWVLERWSDRDGDGVGAHFGGRDCDEGDHRRHAGAVELAGDGVDHDCDGKDDPSGAGPGSLSGVEPPPALRADRMAAPDPAAMVAGSTRPADAGTAPASSDAPRAPTSAHDALATTDAGAPRRPDVVLVTLDTVGARHCSAYGYGRDTTPSLAALAGQGVLFVHAYAPGSTTQAAITPLVTGKPFGDSRRSADEWPTLLDENDTLAERLDRAGYATAAVTSFTWLRKDRGFQQGFDSFDESPFRAEHPERASTGPAATLAARKSYEALASGDAPIFLWVHLFDAHAKYVDHEGLDFGKREIDRYDAEVAFTDRQLAELVRMVAAGPRASRTLWLVHGSHGEAFGEHEVSGHGTELWEEMIGVPFVVAAPWLTPRRYEGRAVSTLDIAPTLLELAGASSEGVAGVSLVRLLAGDDAFVRPPVVAHAPRRVAVIDWPLKLLVRKRTGAADRLLLFDLAADPGERNDVSSSRQAELDRLAALRLELEKSRP